MRIFSYKKYKKSGVPWLGDVPEHWQVMKLHHAVRMKSGSSITSEEMEDDGIYPVFGGNGNRGKYSKFTHEGDFVLIGRQGAECGNINYAHGKFWASEHAVVVTPNRKLVYRWLGETLRAMNLNQYSQSAAQPGLSVEILGRLNLPFPSLEEQRQIAAFLDWKTGQIDALIAKKQALLEKLKEKRLALITQAVTKGLNPNAPLKDSGIPWLGKVPQHWEVMRLKDYGRLIGGAGFPIDEQGLTDEELPFYKVGDLKESKDGRNMIGAPNTISRKTAEELGAKIIPAGSIVYAKIGAALLLNRRRITTVPCCIDNNMTAYFPDTAHLKIEWVHYWLSILDFGEFVNPGAVPSLSEGYQSILPIFVPSLSEQTEIVNYLTTTLPKIDQLSDTTGRTIARLTEYRTALITAATTGKIDVRNVKIPTQQTP